MGEGSRQLNLRFRDGKALYASLHTATLNVASPTKALGPLID